MPHTHTKTTEAKKACVVYFEQTATAVLQHLQSLCIQFMKEVIENKVIKEKKVIEAECNGQYE